MVRTILFSTLFILSSGIASASNNSSDKILKSMCIEIVNSYSLSPRGVQSLQRSPEFQKQYRSNLKQYKKWYPSKQAILQQYKTMDNFYKNVRDSSGHGLYLIQESGRWIVENQIFSFVEKVAEQIAMNNRRSINEYSFSAKNCVADFINKKAKGIQVTLVPNNYVTPIDLENLDYDNLEGARTSYGSNLGVHISN